MKFFSDKLAVTKVQVAVIVIIVIVSVIGVAAYYVTLPAPPLSPTPTPTPTPPKSPPSGPFYIFRFDREASSGFEATYLYEDKDSFNLTRRGTGTIVMVFTSNIDSTIEFELDDLQLDPPPPPSGIELKLEPNDFTLKPDEEIRVNLIITTNMAETLTPLQSEVSISFNFTIPDSGVTVWGKGESFLLTIVKI